MIATSRFTLRRLINDSNARVAFDRLRDVSILEFIRMKERRRRRRRRRKGDSKYETIDTYESMYQYPYIE